MYRECVCPPLVFDDDGAEKTSQDEQRNHQPQKFRNYQESDMDSKARLRSLARKLSPMKRNRIPTTLGGKKQSKLNKPDACCLDGKRVFEDELTVRKVKSGSSITLTHRRIRSSSSVSRQSRQLTPLNNRSTLNKTPPTDDERKHKIICKKPVYIPEPIETRDSNKKKEETKPDACTRILRNPISKTDIIDQTEAKPDSEHASIKRLNVKSEDVIKPQTQENQQKETRGRGSFF